MSIRDKLDSIKLHLGSAYAKIQAKGGTLPTDKNISNLASAIETVEGGGGPSNIRLNAPTLSFGQSSVGNTPLIITNAYNGNFVGSYDFYIDDVLTDNISANLVSNTVNLQDYITELGTYTIKVISKGTNFIDSLAATISYSSALRITNNLTNCSNNNSATEIAFGVSYNATLVADEGYSFVGAEVEITMGGVDITSTCYNKGKIAIPIVTGNIVITATFAVITQLETPSISLSDSILTITQVANAELYVLCLSGSEWQEFPSNTTTIDLANWLTLTDSYNVTIKAKADGYLDSAQSNSVTFTNSTGETPSATLSDNSWPTIRLVCERGQAGNYWNVGDEKTDLGEDETTRTFRIVDMTGLYGKHVVFEETNLENLTSKMANGTHPQWINYDESIVRLTVLPSVLLNFSERLQGAITKSTIKFSYYNSSSDRGVKQVNDKLFIASAKEIDLSNYSLFDDETTTWEYYEEATFADRIKTKDGDANFWWTRSLCWPSSQGVNQVTVTHLGAFYYSMRDSSYSLAPCFAF